MNETKKQNCGGVASCWYDFQPIQKPDIVSLREFNLVGKSGDIDHAETSQPRNRKTILDIQWVQCANENDPRHLISSDSNGEVMLIDIAKNQAIHTEKVCSTWLYCLDAEPFGGKIFCTGSLNSKIFINKLNFHKSEKVTLVNTLIGHRGAIRSVKFMSENIMISGSMDSSIGLWDLNNPQKYLGMLQGHMSDILTLNVCSIDRNIFVSGSSDLCAKLWDIRLKNPQIYNFTGAQSSITKVKFVPNSMMNFIVGGDDSYIRLFDVRMGKEIHKYQDPVNPDPIRS